MGMYMFLYFKDFWECIKIGNVYVEEVYVVDFVVENKVLMVEIWFSFFEIIVVMVFYWFVQQQVDIVVVEVGLGGWLDFINVLMLEFLVIINISFDY